MLFLSLLVLGACGRPSPPRSLAGAERAAALRRQLDGHLARARACLVRSGWIELALTIRTDGRVEDVDVHAWDDEDGSIAACARSRIVSLYFDPAPPSRPIRVARTLESCPVDDAVCRFGVRASAPGELLARVDQSLAERDGAVRACADSAGGGAALLEVRLELGADGRIMAGRLERAQPARTPLRRCAVSPLLGLTIAGPGPPERLQLRHAVRIR